MALQFTGKVESNYTPAPRGNYEVTLKVAYDKTNGGATYIKVTSVIRSDIKQEIEGQGGKLVFDGIYKNKTTGEYNQRRIDYILSAIPNARLTFEDYDDVVQYLNGKTVKIAVDVERKDEENPDSDLKNTVKKYMVSDLYVPNAEQQFEIKDSDLPF
jgi:hypothetical protein